jgi:hypothetical protein
MLNSKKRKLYDVKARGFCYGNSNNEGEPMSKRIVLGKNVLIVWKTGRYVKVELGVSSLGDTD